MGSLRILPPDDDAGPSLQGLHSMFTGDWKGMVDSMASQHPKFPPLEVLPCANVNVDKHAICKQPGKMACSSCKLVSYCSKGCQSAHWIIHKSDCKNSIKSDNWKPGWVVERRDPSFLTKTNTSAAEEFTARFQDRLSMGVSLWGNMPAIDIVNLQNNERDPQTNLSLAFAASGDIRNIVATVNALGSGFSGKLKILLNDLNPYTVSRNITLLLILGTIPDEVMAADIALHFWYSVFIPMEYRLRILSMVSTFLKKCDSAGSIVTSLGPHSTLSCMVSSSVRARMMENVKPVMTPDQAQTEYKRVREAPSRADLRDRMYMGLKPSHRLAFLEYRRFGIILPFGALNAHCNVPNPSLFSNCEWLQTDFADPLESWDVDQVFAAGKVHGAQPEDAYGCLYFFLSDQLRAFARLIRRLHISFHVFNFEACALAQGIVAGELTENDFPPSTRFDRIDVSNIMDRNYVGIRDVVNTWSPLLAKTDCATLTGYFMNWVASAEKGSVRNSDPSTLNAALDLMMMNKRVHTDVDPRLAVFLAMHDVDAFYDNFKVFSEFWRNHGGADVKLQLRTAHRILPHRLRTAVNAKPHALPYFADNETWYRWTRLINRTWTERFVELGHHKT